MWFSAKLLFEACVADESDAAPLQEVSIRLLRAESNEAAQRKAETLGVDGQHNYENESGARVEWRFLRVLEIQDLCEPELYDGMEVYSRLSWRREGAKTRQPPELTN
jgi:Domain of unknown function (DUF4288)